MNYGKELILDLHGCDTSNFTKTRLTEFFEDLAGLTGMELQARHWWTMDDGDPDWRLLPHLNGISCVQFITTSNFTVHALYDGRLYLNIFTCKDFDPGVATRYAKAFFGGTVASWTVVDRI